MSHTINRIATLDILRGFSLVGILFSNIVWITDLGWARPDVYAQEIQTTWNGYLYYLLEMFVVHKFYVIFSFLFGLGFSIILARSEDTNRHQFAYTYVSRITVLFIIGWIHAIFFWFGEILRIYAVMALFLLFFKRLSDRNLFISAIIFLCLPVLMGSAISYYSFHLNINDFIYYSPAEALTIMQHGGMREFVISNIGQTYYFLADNLLYGRFFKILGIFLLGFYVGRKQWFHHVKEYLPFIRKYILWIWGYSLIASFIFMETRYYNAFVEQVGYLFSIYPLALTYVLSIVYISQRVPQSKIIQSLENMGRMSLTNYVGQTVLVCFVIMWYGLGMAGKLSFLDNMILAGCVILLECLWSYYWLKYFKQGPLEYIWRKAVNLIWFVRRYLHNQPH